MQTLQILDGADTFLRPLDGSPVVFGAAASADVQLRTAGIAAQHVRIEFEGDVPWVRALAPGVSVNGRPVERAALALGDRIEVGQVVLVVGTSVARKAQPDDVLGDGAGRRTEVRRRVPAKPKRSVVPFFIAGLAAVGVALFAMFGGGSSLPPAFAELDRLRRAGSFELAQAQVERLRTTWAETEEQRARVEAVAQQLEQTRVLVEERKQAILAHAAERTYAEFSDELQRDERKAADENVRIAARIVRASLTQLLRDAPSILPPELPVQVAKGPDAPKADGAAKPSPVAPSEPVRGGATPPENVAPAGTSVAATEPPAGERAAVGVGSATVSDADIAAVMQDTTRLVAAGQFRQAQGQLEQALAGASAAEAPALRDRIADLRRTAKAAADQLLERARADLAQRKFEPMLSELADAANRFPSGFEFAGLPTMLDELQRAQRAGGSGEGTRVSGDVDAETRRATLVLVAGAFEQSRVLEEAGDFLGAAAPLRTAIAEVQARDPGYAAQIQLRLDEFEAIAELQARTAAYFGGNRSLELPLRNGRSGVLHGAAGNHLLVRTSDGESQIGLGDLSPAGLAKLVADARLGPVAQLGAAALLYRSEAPKEAEALLAQLLKADESQKDRIDRALAKGRGEPIDPRGYRLRADGFVSVAVLEAEKTAGKVLARIDAVVRSKDPAAREAFVTEALALGPTALQPVILALHRSLQKEMDQLEKSALRKQVERVAVQRRQLDEARTFAKELIYDEVKYFYPYNPPAVSSDRLAEYMRVQAEVDRRVAAVRDLWNDDKAKVKVPATLRDALQRIDWVGAVLRDLGELDALALLSIEWARALPIGDTITIRNFCLTPAEREQYELWERIEAYNRGLAKQLDGPQREQLQVTNDYRRMFGHRPLAMDLHLRDAALGHAQEMAKLGYFSHFSPTPGRRTPGERMALAGYKEGVGENIALNDSPQLAHAAWCRSSGHHRNLLNPAHTEVGTVGYGRYWVQNFGHGTGHLASLPPTPAGR